MIGLETDRLIFRQWEKSDFPAIAEFYSDKENAQFVGGTKNSEQAWRLMATYIGHYALHGYSYLAIDEKATGNFIGSLGLWNSEPWPELELGYWLLPAAQGKAYGQEAGLAVKNYAINVLKVPSLVSYIHSANQPSIKLATRLGATYDSSIQLLDFGPHEVYRYA